MKIINNTNKNIILVTGEKVPAYGDTTIYTVSEELNLQLENLKKNGLIRTI